MPRQRSQTRGRHCHRRSSSGPRQRPQAGSVIVRQTGCGEKGGRLFRGRNARILDNSTARRRRLTISTVSMTDDPDGGGIKFVSGDEGSAIVVGLDAGLCVSIWAEAPSGLSPTKYVIAKKTTKKVAKNSLRSDLFILFPRGGRPSPPCPTGLFSFSPPASEGQHRTARSWRREKRL